MTGAIEIHGSSGERLILHYTDEAKGKLIGVHVEWVIGHTVRLPYQWHLEKKYFSRFQDQLVQCRKEAAGQACLSPEDKRFYVLIKSTRGGHFVVEGNFEYEHTSYGVSSKYRLTGSIEFETDQSMLQPTIAGLIDMIESTE